MKVLLAVACLLAVASAQVQVTLEPGAKRGTFLNSIQQLIINTTMMLYPDGTNMDQGIRIGVMTTRNDLCKISNPDTQSHNSIILGKSCKKAFVKLYNEEPDRCGGVFCDVLTDVESKTLETMTDLINAEFDSDFFDLIEERFINPIMEYSCKCSGKMMDAWMGCKQNIGDADIWATLVNFGGFDTEAEYLGGMDWKEYWVDFVVETVPWEGIQTMLERTMANLCQVNTDIKRGDSKCYSYFYDAFNTLFQAYMKSSGLPAATKKRGGSSANDQCTTYDLSEFMDMGMNITFGDIKEAVEEQFCVEECADFYQEEFLGCCTASMVQDEVLEESVKSVAKDIVEVFSAIFPEDEEAANTGFAEYIGYYNEAMDMMRNPTCVDTSVSYDMTPCTVDNPCDGLSGKDLKKCKKKNKGGNDEGDDAADACAGLSGKKLKKCKKAQKKNKGGNDEGDDAADACAGLSGKKLKICKKKAKKGNKG